MDGTFPFIWESGLWEEFWACEFFFPLHLHLRLRFWWWLCLLRSALKILDTPFRALAESAVLKLYWYDIYYAIFN